MKKIYRIIASIFLTVAVCNTVYATEHEIKMLNMGADGSMVFEPGYLKVNPGDTVKFVPTDAGHNSVSSFTPDGGVTWKGDISKEVIVKMDKEGVYLYVCVPHSIMAMAGVIQVGNAANLPEAKKAAEELSGKFAMSKDRLGKYMAQVK